MTIIQGNCLDVLKTFSDNHFTSIITDPPYGLSFMGKKWDYDIPSIEIWKECLRVLKRGGTMLCFAGSRTQHRMAINVEDGGFILKDCLMWLYGSGFPKATDISKRLDKTSEAKQFDGYKTHSLKPAYEPILLAMKPNDGTYAQNALKWGISGLNIDAGRIRTNEDTGRPKGPDGNCYGHYNQITIQKHELGRFPSNILLDEEAAKMLDEHTGILKSGALKDGSFQGHAKEGIYQSYSGFEGREYKSSNGGGSRFFYCAKASPSERNGSTHPTVKPLALMEYLIKLIMPPKDGLLLDPFAGSGTTIVAAIKLSYESIGIELEEEYFEIAKKRIEYEKQQFRQLKLI